MCPPGACAPPGRFPPDRARARLTVVRAQPNSSARSASCGICSPGCQIALMDPPQQLLANACPGICVGQRQVVRKPRQSLVSKPAAQRSHGGPVSGADGLAFYMVSARNNMPARGPDLLEPCGRRRQRSRHRGSRRPPGLPGRWRCCRAPADRRSALSAMAPDAAPDGLGTAGYSAPSNSTRPVEWSPSWQQRPGRCRAGAGNIPACGALRRARCGCWNPSRPRNGRHAAR